MAAWVRALGLPGIVDLHVHFMPESVMRKVWAFFDEAGRHYGRDWPVAYRHDELTRLETLRGLGVVAFSSLVYPHKPGMAQWLNEWAGDFAARTPGCLRTFTFFPEPGASEVVRAALESGGQVAKVHVQVGAFDPRDELIDECWGLLSEAQVPVVVHCGSGPVPGAHTGPGPFAEVLARHPSLTAVIAHMGCPEYADFLDLAARFDRVHLDTTMAFTAFMEARAPFPREERARLLELGLAGRIVFGSDFPNIPYPYADQVRALAELDLGEEWLRAVLYGNGADVSGIAREMGPS